MIISQDMQYFKDKLQTKYELLLLERALEMLKNYTLPKSAKALSRYKASISDTREKNDNMVFLKYQHIKYGKQYNS